MSGGGSSEIGAAGVGLAAVSALVAGLSDTGWAAVCGVVDALGNAVGCNTGAAIAAGFGRLAEADASGAGGFVGAGTGVAVALFAGNATLGTAGSGAVAGALTGIV